MQLEQARLIGAHLEGSALTYANLRGADLTNAYLESADLFRAHFGAERPGSWVRTFFDARTVLREAVLANANQVSPRMLDVRWGGVNLTALDWAPVRMVGDEYRARQRTVASGEQSDRTSRLREYQAAVRTNRQLATVLRGQGLNEEADRFAYRAQLLQRQVLRPQRRWGRAFGSWLMDTVAGYGYKPMRSVIAYVLIICLFAGAYLLNAQFAAPHLSWDEALVLSISSFHGRGFFTTGINLGDTLARLAAGEAIVGLLIEITFIATFTQRFFAR